MNQKLLSYESQQLTNNIHIQEKSYYFKKHIKDLKFQSVKDSDSNIHKKSQSNLQRKLLNQVKSLQKQNRTLKSQILSLKQQKQQLVNKVRYFIQLNNFLDLKKSQNSLKQNIDFQITVSDCFEMNFQTPIIHINPDQTQNKHNQQGSINIYNINSSSTICSQDEQVNGVFSEQEQLQTRRKQCLSMKNRRIAQILLKNNCIQQKTKNSQNNLKHYFQGKQNYGCNIMKKH